MLSPFLEGLRSQWYHTLNNNGKVYKNDTKTIITTHNGHTRKLYCFVPESGIISKQTEYEFSLFGYLVSLGIFRKVEYNVSENDWQTLVNSLEIR